VNALDVGDTLAVADQLPNLEVPAQVVWGAADAFQKVEYGERLAWTCAPSCGALKAASTSLPKTIPTPSPKPPATSSLPPDPTS
jgi:hypothetical protein